MRSAPLVMSMAPSWHCLVLPFSMGRVSSVTGASVMVLRSIQTWVAVTMPMASIGRVPIAESAVARVPHGADIARARR